MTDGYSGRMPRQSAWQIEFEINGEKRIVKAGDTMLKLNGVEHGCVCLKEGVLLDIFNPMREDFV